MIKVGLDRANHRYGRGRGLRSVALYKVKTLNSFIEVLQTPTLKAVIGQARFKWQPGIIRRQAATNCCNFLKRNKSNYLSEKRSQNIFLETLFFTFFLEITWNYVLVFVRQAQIKV